MTDDSRRGPLHGLRRQSVQCLGMVGLIAGPVLAQPPSTGTTPNPSPTAPAAPAYRSAFDGYRPFADEPAGNWRELNETVRAAGGWRAYARETEPDPVRTQPTDAPKGAGGMEHGVAVRGTAPPSPPAGATGIGHGTAHGATP